MSAARIALLQDRIQAREGKAGYKRNVQALRAEVARLQEAAKRTPDSENPAG